MANLKFYKMAQAPVGTTEKPLEKGAVWFDSTNHVIRVYDGANWTAYSGVIDASVANEILTIKKYDGSTVSVDFSVYATDEALGLLDERVGTLEGTVAGHGESISDLSGRMTTVEGKAAKAEAKLADIAEGETVKAVAQGLVNVEKERAMGVEGGLDTRLGTLETKVNTDHEGRIAGLEAKFTGEDSVADQIADAVAAAEGRVDGKLAGKADKATYEAYVAANDERVGAVEKEIDDEVLRATGAEAAINAKIGGSYGTEEGQVTVAADIQAAKDAAAEAQRTIDEFLTGEGVDPNAIENLKEIVAYITEHKDVADGIIGDLSAAKNAIDVLNGNAETVGSVAKAVADAKAEINATIEANEKVTAEALSELDGRVDALEGMGLAGVIEGFEDRIAANEAAVATVDSRIATAKAGAEATAAADATSKANTAESNAKGYADGLIAAEITRSNKYADDAVAAEALIARAAEKANADAIAALDSALKAGEGFAWVTFE